MVQLLSTIVSLSFLICASHAFTISTPSSTCIGTSSQSCLFRSAKTIPYKKNTIITNSNDQLLSSVVQQMTNNDNGEKETETESETESEVVSTTSSTSSSSSITSPQSFRKATVTTSATEQNGFLTALVLAPPLIAKFGIVLLVKVATDLVVFPLLYSYRFCKIVKNKLVGEQQQEQINGEKVNGGAM